MFGRRHKHIESQLAQIAGDVARLAQFLAPKGVLMLTLDDLIAKVQAETTVEQSAISLLNGLSQQLKDAIASNDPAKIQAVADTLDANNAALAAAVAANTTPTA